MEKQTKYCGTCKEHKATTDFAKNRAKRDGLQERCKECRAAHYRHSGYKDKAFENRLSNKYGITKENYQDMLVTQRGCCASCGDLTDKLVVDHCHTSGKVRALLCHGCNTALGLLKEDIERCEALIEYKKRHCSA